MSASCTAALVKRSDAIPYAACSRLIPVSESYDGDKFFTIAADGVKSATPLLLALAVVEISDVVFAVDSIPAVRISGRTPVCNHRSAARRRQHEQPMRHARQPAYQSRCCSIRLPVPETCMLAWQYFRWCLRQSDSIKGQQHRDDAAMLPRCLA